MIGVALKHSNPSIVEEFFQLFKTPWEFFRREGHYDVVISEFHDLTLLKSRLIIVMELNTTLTLAGRDKWDEAIFIKAKQTVFPVYSGVRRINGDIPFLFMEKTGESVGTKACDYKKIVLKIGFNIFQEVEYLLKYGQPTNFAEYPTLDIHIANLRRWILESGSILVEVPPVPKGYNFFVCLTHDVDFVGIKNHKFDRTLAGFVFRATVLSVRNFIKGMLSLKEMFRNWFAVGSLPLIHAGLMKDFWYKFKEYTEIENGLQSTFFFVPFKGVPGQNDEGSAFSNRAVKYEVDDLKREIEFLVAGGNEVGVHGIDSWFDIEKAKKELRKIEKLTRQTDLGIRMHWLYFKQGSPTVLEKAGYSFDSTSGFNDNIGCRSGTFQAYRPLGVKHLIEIPLHIMDTALFYPDRMNLNFREGLMAIMRLTRNIRDLGGVMTVNWHHRSIAPERLWGCVYRDALFYFRSEGGKFATAGNVVKWFRKRRSIVFDRIVLEGSTVKVKLKTEDVKGSDDFVLRVYQPRRGELGDQISEKPAREFQDYSVIDQNEIIAPLLPEYNGWPHDFRLSGLALM